MVIILEELECPGRIIDMETKKANFGEMTAEGSSGEDVEIGFQDTLIDPAAERSYSK